MRMRGRKLFVALALALVATAIAVPVFASHVTTGTVGATVTPGFVAVSVTPASVAYGTINLTVTEVEPGSQVCTAGTSPAFTATNDGNVDATFTIRGDNSNPDNWILSSPDAGSDAYVHRFSTGPVSTVCTFTDLDTDALELATGIAGAASQAIYLNFDAPTDVTSGTTVQTLNVTVVASS